MSRLTAWSACVTGSSNAEYEEMITRQNIKADELVEQNN
jgi:hypothetical protein